MPAESSILAGVQQDLNVAFGGNLNFGTTSGSPVNATPQSQLATSLSAIIANTDETFLFYSTQTDPAYAEGRFQDAIGRIYFMERIGATPTTLSVLCIGAVGTTIPVGALVVDPGNNLYSNLTTGTIGTDGEVTLSFAAQTIGFLPIPGSVAIYQALPGWDTATILSGVTGQDTESRAAFETRRALSTAANSNGSLPSILGAVLGVPNVQQAVVLENTSSSPTTVSGVAIAANSVYVSVYGPLADPVAVGRAIWSRKAPGCAYGGGNTTVTVQDTSPGYSTPFPSYTVTYQNANPLPLLFSVQLVNSVGVPANATAQIQQAIINAGAGNPNALNVVDGPMVAIGQKIWASRFVPSVSALGTWAEGQVIEIQIGSNNDPDGASGNGYCAGTSLYMRSISTGSLGVGQTISISNGSGVVIPGTTIVSQISGAAGGTGVYVISTAQMLGQENFLDQSNTFNVTWGSVNSTVTGSSAISPDGTNDGWLWQRSGTASAYFFQGITSISGLKPASSLIYTFSIYAKPGIGNYLAIVLTDSPGSGAALVTFNVNAGTISTSVSTSGTFSNASATIVPAANGWYRCSLTAQTSVDPSLTAAFSGNSNNTSYNSTDALSNTSIYVYGAQLEGGSIAQTYIPTTANVVCNTVLGFATPNQNFVQVQLNQIPTIAAGNIVVSYV
jgi:Baseplate J-like protein